MHKFRIDERHNREVNQVIHRIFVLSPANCAGRRAQMLLKRPARFDLAQRLWDSGAPIGELFTFMSGLYFRGKLAYATAFARPSAGLPGVWVITSGEGLVSSEESFTISRLQGLAGIPIDSAEPRYSEPLARDARRIADVLAGDSEVILLGSIASGKYTDILSDAFGERLRFPAAFVGRGDMSRGGLMLRCVDDDCELEYVPVNGAVLRGARPPKLGPRKK